MALRDVDSELWNVPEFFQRHALDLILGSPVNEFNPKLIIMRLPREIGK
jgi:hypothetical protein